MSGFSGKKHPGVSTGIHKRLFGRSHAQSTYASLTITDTRCSSTAPETAPELLPIAAAQPALTPSVSDVTMTVFADASPVAHGVNIGHGYVKSALVSQADAQVETVVFPALIARAPRTLEGALRHIARVEVGGLHFVVGEDAQTARMAQTYLSHQRLSDSHFIPALLRGALERLEYAGDRHGYCVTGLPASWALQPALCRQLAERLREGTALYTKVRVIPEPLGLVYAMLLNSAGEIIGDPTLSSGRVLVVDLGYHTVDVAILDQLFPVRERLRTAELGLAHALGEIQQQLSAVFGRPYSLFEVDQAVRTGVVKVAGELRPLPQGWDRPLLVLADQVAAALVEAAGSAAQYDAVLLGGGGAEQERLAAAITRRFAHAQVVAGAQTAIARGYAALAMRYARGLE